jgi:type IV pilus assembly protein PilP
MSVRIRATLVAIALLGLSGCQDDGTGGPTTADFSSARADLAAEETSGSKKKARAKAKKKSEPSESVFATEGRRFHYDPRGKRDPFRSFEWEQMKLDVLSDEGPLERFDVGQLSLVGVVWDASNARALVQDPSGMSYIVGEGARVGKNEGRVTRIDDNLMVVKETYVDWQGEETTKDIEMRIRVTEGG